MTTNDLASGRAAATRRSLPGSLRFLVPLLLGLASLPALAAQPSGALPPATPAVAAELSPTAGVLPAISDPLPLPDRAMLFAGDLNRLIGSRASAGDSQPAAGGRVQSVLQRALALLGTPYRWGGTSTAGFDCSGLVGYVFRTTLGIELPRVSREMAASGTPVERTALTPGDLVFFSLHGGHRVDHVGIYMGEGRFLHAPRTGRDVTVSSLDSGYWSGKFLQARRVAGI